MPTILRRTYDSKTLQFDTRGSFLLKIHIIFCLQYAKFRSAAYEKVHLDLLQSFLKIKPKTHSISLANLQINFEVPFSLELTILSSGENVINMFCLITKIFTTKRSPKTSYGLGCVTYKIRHCMKSLPTLAINQVCQCGRKRLRSGKIQIFFSKYLQNQI